jgi:hypothetical protein
METSPQVEDMGLVLDLGMAIWAIRLSIISVFLVGISSQEAGKGLDLDLAGATMAMRLSISSQFMMETLLLLVRMVPVLEEVTQCPEHQACIISSSTMEISARLVRAVPALDLVIPGVANQLSVT